MEQNSYILITFYKIVWWLCKCAAMLLQEQQNQNEMVINDIAVWPCNKQQTKWVQLSLDLGGGGRGRGGGNDFELRNILVLKMK
jgi:hypothetical protein